MTDYNGSEQLLNTNTLQLEPGNVDVIEQVLADFEKEEFQLKQKIKGIEEKIATLEKKRQALDEIHPDQETVEQQVIKDQLASSQKELSELMKTRTDISKKIKTLQERGDKNFDKYKLFKNIRELANKKNIRLGQIERDSGCQAGYMSRLEKPENTTDPTVEFVVTAAKTLEVSIDLLIYSDFMDMTPTEVYISKFIERLIKDTRGDEIVWKSTSNGKDRFRPLFKTKQNQDAKKDVLVYSSRFFPDKKLDCSYKSFCAELGESEAYIYLMRCLDSEPETKRITEFFEVYIIDSDEVVHPVFCTAQTGKAMVSLVDRLYEEVEESIAHIHVNNDIKEIIDAYMKLKTDNE